MTTTQTQHPPTVHPFIVAPANLRHVSSCPFATSYTAWSVEHHAYLLCSVSCRRWSCGWCSRKRIKKLAALTALAAPNRLLTLTVDPLARDDPDHPNKLRYHSPRDAFDATSPKVPELLRKLRVKFGAIEYLRVTEVTTGRRRDDREGLAIGYPHYHLLVRSGFLPHACVKATWQDLTGAQIVDLRQVKETFSAYWYLVKYLSKLHDKTWTERHVSYSKNFFPIPASTSTTHNKLEKGSRDMRHPHVYLCELYAGLEAYQLAEGVYKLPPNTAPQTQEIDPKSIGLPRPKSSNFVPKTQQPLGFSDRDPNPPTPPAQPSQRQTTLHDQIDMGWSF